MRAHKVEVDRGARTQHDRGADGLAHAGVGRCDRDLGNRGMGGERVLHLARRYILAAPDDVLLAVGDEQIAMPVEMAMALLRYQLPERKAAAPDGADTLRLT
jgi:hypothetical protein